VQRVEQKLWTDYVDTGLVQYIYWPVFSYGEASLSAYMVMECAGQQDLELAWTAHNLLYENTSSLMQVNPDLYMAVAQQVGLNMDQFNTCFSNPDSIQQAVNLDEIAKERGITGHPIFEFVGVGYLIGSQPISVFEDAIETVMNQ